jgi:hypothetical protein
VWTEREREREREIQQEPSSPSVSYMNMRVAVDATQEMKKTFKMFSLLHGKP